MNKYSDKLTDEHGDYYIGYANNTESKFYVDAEDYKIIKPYNWYETYSGKTRLLRTNINKSETQHGRTSIGMHQLLGFEKYDHIDKNELNNRRYNLRPCSHQQNCCNRGLRSDNTTGFTGVYQRQDTGKWFAQLYTNGKNHYGLSRDTFEEAKIDRLKLEAKYMKEFSPNINLFDQYGIVISYNDDKETITNQKNTSGYIGVTYDKSRCKWHVTIRENGRTKYIGRFTDKNDAIIARLKAEAKYYGEFSPQRHLFEKYNINPSDEGKEVLEDILAENIKDETELEDEL